MRAAVLISISALILSWLVHGHPLTAVYASASPSCPADRFAIASAARRCEDLGLAASSGKVCSAAARRGGKGECFGARVSWRDSATACRAEGMRLCRAADASGLPGSARAAIQTCAAAVARVAAWTAEPCAGGRMALLLPEGRTECRAETELHTIVCCSDQRDNPVLENSETICAPCPDGAWTAPAATRRAWEAELGNGVEACSSRNLRANLLLLLADDLKTSLSGAGFNDPLARTPNIDRAAARGVSFRNAHSAIAMCTPARAALLSGRRPDVTRVIKINDPLRGSVKDLTTLPKRLSLKGHFKSTAAIGKIFDHRNVDDQDGVRSWSEPWSGWRPSKFWIRPESGSSSSGQCSRYANKDPFYDGYPSLPTVQCLSSSRGGDEAYGDYHVAERAVQLVRSLQRPWFLAVGFQRPHLPWTAPEQDWYQWSREEFSGEYSSRGKRWAKGAAAFAIPPNEEMASYGDWRKGSAKPTPAMHALARHGYYASVSYVDRMMGRVLDYLNETNGFEDTIVVVTSDHGFHLGENKRLFGKKTVYEHATRVPLILLGPDRYLPLRGWLVDEPVEHLDLYPTLLKLLDIPHEARDEELDGVAVNDLFSIDASTRARARPRLAAVAQFPARHKKSVMSYSLRGRRFKYVCHVSGGAAGKRKCLRDEIYDMKLDPAETDARPNSPEKRVALKLLRGVFNRHRSKRWLGLMAGRGGKWNDQDRAALDL